MPAHLPRRRQHPGRALLAVALAGSVAAILPVASARAANPIDVVFSPVDAEQSWVVPGGVTTIHVVLIGAKGSGGGGYAGGYGHNVSGDLAVNPGSTIYVEVGGKGLGATPGFNGGGLPGTDTSGTAGAGGGASDIRTISRMQPGTIDSRLMVAGGGGGVGRSTTGGNAGQRGNDSTMGGQPGSSASGGAGGVGDPNGSAGSVGVGGAGGTWCGFDVCADGKAGGGGGGGYYGGGGGAGTLDTSGLAQSGSGGGGSAYTGNATNASIGVETELNASITITYTLGSTSTTNPPSSAATPVEVAFQSTGGEQSWTVPSGVTSIHVELVGGKGGDAGPGGFGHVLSGDLSVAPGDILFVEVGGNGANSIGLPGAAGGFNGGGNGGTGGGGATAGNAGSGGGGATDIRSVSRSSAGTLQSRLFVAGGGGGRGGDMTLSTPLRGGAGGSAGSAGSSGPSGSAGQGGGAGTGSVGGAAGIGGSSSPGTAGSGGVGGVDDNAGGGGGGGYFGGGGGGAGHFNVGGGGGGGGSSFVGTATNISIAVDDTGTPKATITYGGGATPPDETASPDQGTVDATISMTSSVCIELSTNSVDFGNGRFGETNVVGTPDIEVSNCGPDPVALYARGTDATAPGASWDLVNDASTCADTLGVDAYHLRLIDSQTLDDEWGLGLTNALLQSVDVGAVGSYGPRIDTACSGSSGAGQQMSMQIVFTATASEP